MKKDNPCALSLIVLLSPEEPLSQVRNLNIDILQNERTIAFINQVYSQIIHKYSLIYIALLLCNRKPDLSTHNKLMLACVKDPTTTKGMKM